MRVAQTVVTFVHTRDMRLMRVVHRWRAPHWIRLWMICATRGGDGWLWYAMAAAVLALGGESRYRAVAACGGGSAIGIAVFLALKRLTGRRRPCHIEPHCWANLLPPDRFSFPSGHTITAFAVSTPLSLFYPDMMAGVMFCAFSIAISRILLGMHFLSDVLAGAILGTAIGFWTYGLALL